MRNQEVRILCTTVGLNFKGQNCPLTLAKQSTLCVIIRPSRDGLKPRAKQVLRHIAHNAQNNRNGAGEGNEGNAKTLYSSVFAMAGSVVVSRLLTGIGSLSLNLSKSITKSVIPTIYPLKSSSESQVSSSLKHLSRDLRLPVQLSCLVSIVPLHNAIASARLTSMLSAESQSWGLTPQASLWYGGSHWLNNVVLLWYFSFMMNPLLVEARFVGVVQ